MQGYSKCDGTFDVLWLTPPVANWRVLSLGPATRKHEEKSHHHYAWQKLLHLPQERERTLTGFYSIPSTFILSVPARESSNRVPGRAHNAALEDQTIGLTRAMSSPFVLISTQGGNYRRLSLIRKSLRATCKKSKNQTMSVKNKRRI